MTNWDARSTEVNLSFLKDNVSYQATIFKDAPNSYEQPKEYMVEKRTVDSKTILNINMAKAVDSLFVWKQKTNIAMNEI